VVGVLVAPVQEIHPAMLGCGINAKLKRRPGPRTDDTI